MKNARTWMLGLSGLVVLALAGWLGMPRLRLYVFHGAVMQSPEPATDFTLTAQTGERTKLSDFRGKVVVLSFGYTFCPDVCPATLSKEARAFEILGSKADQVQAIMVTVDPERDTPERLNQYMSIFGPNFIGLTGTPDEIAAVATPFGIYYERQEGTAATSYLMDHTATVTVIDQKGYVRLLFPFDITAQDMAEDLAYLLR